jgi:putative oxidoreductase
MDRWDRPRLGLLVLRISLGLVFLLHGLMKFFGGEISFIREMLLMAGWSVPGPLLWVAAIIEVISGTALLLGVLTRQAAWLLAFEMIVAVALFHLRQGFFIVAVPNVPLAYGFEYHLTLIGGLICVALSGPGAGALSDSFGPSTGRASRRSG